MVIDPDDDIAVLRSIRCLASPAHGRAVITPTPGNHGGGVLYHDILAGVGHSWRPDWLRMNAKIQSTTVEALRRLHVEDLIILRAQALNGPSWYYLGELARRMPLRLWLVVHGCRPNGNHLFMIHGRGVRVRQSRPGAAPLDCLPPATDVHCHFDEKFTANSVKRTVPLW